MVTIFQDSHLKQMAEWRFRHFWKASLLNFCESIFSILSEKIANIYLASFLLFNKINRLSENDGTCLFLAT